MSMRTVIIQVLAMKQCIFFRRAVAMKIALRHHKKRHRYVLFLKRNLQNMYTQLRKFSSIKRLGELRIKDCTWEPTSHFNGFEPIEDYFLGQQCSYRHTKPPWLAKYASLLMLLLNSNTKIFTCIFVFKICFICLLQPQTKEKNKADFKCKYACACAMNIFVLNFFNKNNTFFFSLGIDILIQQQKECIFLQNRCAVCRTEGLGYLYVCVCYGLLWTNHHTHRI